MRLVGFEGIFQSSPVEYRDNSPDMPRYAPICPDSLANFRGVESYARIGLGRFLFFATFSHRRGVVLLRIAVVLPMFTASVSFLADG